ncbi:MAG TPA: glycoside hydrolase family 9 protein [Verrucomicrobiae bacterium]|jgi:peptidoglycan/xylan/chitin deacetylase (PgdA/CDA1 family)|nr:glycoside hydrolase family 9 protein [Verrucomicrobiae bacterium]
MGCSNFHKFAIALAFCLLSIRAFAQTKTDGWTLRDGGVIRGPVSERKVALVFTGDNFAESGNVILSELARHNARASFFLTGNFLTNAEFAPLVRRMVAQGDYIGPHSDRHLLFCDWNSPAKTLVTSDQFHADLNANLDKLAGFGITRAESQFFLPAFEHFNSDIARWSAQMGLTLVNFTPGTRANADYTGETDRDFVSSAAIFDSIVRRDHEDPRGLNGFILLLHIGSGPARADKFAGRFGALLDYLASRGYQCVRIDELLAASDAIYIRANQIGYGVSEPKTAIAFSTASLPKSFSVTDVKSDIIVFTREAKPLQGAAWGQFTNHMELDFSSLTNPGNYCIQYGGAVSLPFTIQSHPLTVLPDELLEFMREQRCGYNPWLGTNCHQLDGRTSYGPLPPGTQLNVTGGWHDAGDTLKYLVTSETATADMLLAYDVASHKSRKAAPDAQERFRAGYFGDRVNAMGNAGSNRIPDILDEARWGLDWMLKMHPASDTLYFQVGDDRDHIGWRLPQNDTADYGWGQGGARVVYYADGRPQGLGKYKSASTGIANLAGTYAAAMALAYQIWRDDPLQATFAARCLQAGREVYAMGKSSEGVQQGNSYSAPYRYAPTIWAQDMEWGAAELFRATGKQTFLSDAEHYAKLAADENWMGRKQTGHYQYYPFLNAGHFRLFDLVDDRFKRRLAGYYQAGIDRCVRAGNKNPYHIGVPFIWCSDNLVVALATQCLMYEQMTGDTRYHQFASAQNDWLLGRNPWGMTAFTGVGCRFPCAVHLMTHLLGRNVRGGMVDGPVYDRIFNSLKGVGIAEPDPLAPFQGMAVYHDDLHDYSSNEPTMDGTAAAILMFVMACR